MSFWQLRRESPLTGCLVIIGIAFLVCLALLGNGFVMYDDNTQIYQNATVKYLSLSSFIHIFSSYDPELYAPLTRFAYQLIHLFFGFSPAAYHLVSLLLHLFSAVLLGWIVHQIFNRRWITYVTVALFAFHPLQSEAWLWAAALKDVLSAFFFLLSVGLYLVWQRDRYASIYIWSIVCFALALLSKVSAVPLPLALLLIDHLQQRKLSRNAWMEKWPYFGLAAIFIVIALGGKSGALSHLGFVTVLLLGIKSVPFYLWKFVWPFHFSVLYPQLTSVTFSAPEFWLPLVLTLLLIIGIFVFWKRSAVISSCIAFYLLMLIPGFASAYKNGFVLFASDRYAYLAIIGIYLLFAYAVDRFVMRFASLTKPLVVLCGLIVIGLAADTFLQITIWKNTQTLFANAVMLYPHSALAQNNLGAAETDTGAALSHYEKAIALDPTYLLPYQNIAHIDQVRGDTLALTAISESGVSVFDHKAMVGNDDLSFMFAYGEYLDEAGQSDRALALFKDAATKAPDSAEAHFNLGLKEEKYGRSDDALLEYESAAAIGSDDPRLYYQLASLAASKGKLQEAADALKSVLNLDPNYPNAAQHLTDIENILRQQSQ